MDCSVSCYDYGSFDQLQPYIIKDIKKSRKEHTCCECHEVIPKGSAYQLHKGILQGEWVTHPMCKTCVNIWDSTRCQYIVFGTLREIIEESYCVDYVTGRYYCDDCTQWHEWEEECQSKSES